VANAGVEKSCVKHGAVEQKLRECHEKGDFEGMATLAIRSYGEELFCYLIGLLQNDLDAEEVFAQTCYEMWGSLESFQWKSQFRTWVYAIAHKTGALFLRGKARWRTVRLEDVPHIGKLVEHVRTQTRPYLRTDVKSGVSSLRQHLTMEEQVLLHLRIDRDMSWREVAEVTLAGDNREESELQRESTACRKRFERIKIKLMNLAEEAGLLD